MSSRREVGRIQRRIVASALALSLATAGAITGAVSLDASQAEAATTSTLRTNTTRAALAKDIALSSFATGSTTVIVAQDSVAATHIGGVAAARAGTPLLVSTSGSSSASVLSTLQTLKATKVVLVGSTVGYFTTAFKNELSASSITVTSTSEAASTFDLSVKAATVSGTPSEYVIARSDNAQAVAIATSFAASRGLPLVVWASDTPAASLKTFFGGLGSSVITSIGDPLSNPTDQMLESQIETLRVFDTADAQKAFTWSTSDEQAAGRTINNVTVAPGNSLDSLALAGVVARKSGGIVAPAGNTGALTTNSRADEYLKLWKARTTRLTLVGTGLTSTDLTNVSKPTTSADTAAPAFRTTNLVKTSTGYTLSVTAVSGATSYKAYALDGTVLASATTPSLALTAELSAALVTAESTSGELARLNVRANQYTTEAERTSVILASTDAGKNNLQILGATKIPRLITRVTNDPYDPSVAPGSEIPVAITCASTFTETGLDATKEYEYSITDLTNVDATTCDAALAPTAAAAAAFNSMQLDLPSTAEPAWAGSGARSSATPVRDKKATMTITDRLVAQSMGSAAGSENSFSAQAAPGDDWPPLMFRWIAYIPEAKVPYPAYSGDPAKPVTAFKGDGHGTNDPNATDFKYRQDLTFYFGSANHVTYSEAINDSVRYKCTIRLSNCVETGRQRAPLSELNILSASSGYTAGQARIKASTTLPLVSIAPPIDSEVVVRLAPGSSVMAGYNDLMPQHEAYIGVPNSEWYRVYKSPYNSFIQLPCLYSSPEKPIPYCGIKFNVRL